MEEKRNFDLLTLGQVLLRLSPPNNDRLVRGDTFVKQVGGAELNVAVGVALLGLRTGVISKLPSHDMGSFMKGKIRSYGVSDDFFMYDDSPSARVGIYYYENGAYPRKPKVIYDRANSFFYALKFEEFAEKEGLYAHSINGDAFSKEIKDQVIETIRNDLGTVDLVVYSLAAPRRTMADGTVYQSVLKTTGEIYKQKSLNLRDNTITEAVIEPATPEEIFATEKVMGGEDWYDWMNALENAGVLSKDAVTVAYSYIGPELTYPIYYNGTIGAAKKNLHGYAEKIEP